MNFPCQVTEITSLCTKYPDIAGLYLFGSQAEGRARADSDFDFAIVPRTSTDPEYSAILTPENLRFEFITELTKLGFDSVSVVLIDFTDVYLAFQAVKNNVLIYGRDDFARHDFYSRVVRQFLDFEPFLIRQQKKLKEDLLHG